MIKRYYYAEHAGDILRVTLKDLCLGFMPLIWYNAGLYGIISKEKVENMIRLIEDQENLPTIDVNKEVGVFHWDEIIELDQKIGRLL